MTSGRTIVCGLIGDPVEHSVSPAMQNAAFKERGLDWVYVPFRVAARDVEAAIRGMRALGIRGLNVTIPHKVTVMPLLNRVDSFAQEIGAVNTIVNDAGVLTGYNTDAEGFIKPLLEKGIGLAGRRVLVIGAGGAARGVAFALMESGATLMLLNRSMERARQLILNLQYRFSACPQFDVLTEDSLQANLKAAEILVNATSVGMSAADETPVPGRLLRKDLVVYDIVYNPIRTRLLREAAEAGAVTISGADMLAWQGALAFEKWTGSRAPIELMKRVVREELEKHEV